MGLQKVRHNLVTEQQQQHRFFKHFVISGTGPGCSLEGLILKLKLQDFGYLMRRADSFEKTLMLGKIEDRRGDDRG